MIKCYTNNVYFTYFTDHFSGSNRAIGLVCLRLCRPVCLEPLTYWLLSTLSRSSSNIKVTGQSSRSRDENVLFSATRMHDEGTNFRNVPSRTLQLDAFRLFVEFFAISSDGRLCFLELDQ